MEPQIQYATTEDAVSIAYAVAGEGPPLLQIPILFGDIGSEQEIPELRAWYQRLAKTHTLIRYDPRGSGSSDRSAYMETAEHMYRDIAGVLGAVGEEPVAILCGLPISMGAILYAARHPNGVSHLILWDAIARAQDFTPKVGLAATRELIGRDWKTYTDAWAHTQFGWSATERGHAWARMYRIATSPEAVLAVLAVANSADVSEQLPNVQAQTLVVAHNQPRSVSQDAVRMQATEIPNARLVVRSGSGVPPYAEPSAPDGPAGLIDEFTGVKPASATRVPEPPAVQRDLMVVLFTDMASSTSLTQQLGDAGAQEVRRTHNDIVRAALDANAGSEIKHTGDGIMASFSTASSALDAAIAIQRGVAEHKTANPDSPLAVYVGLNAGEPIAEDDDLFGTSVDLAARLVDHAEPGQILASNVVRELAAGKDFLFSDLGETELRGFEDPVKLWELRWQEDV